MSSLWHFYVFDFKKLCTYYMCSCECGLSVKHKFNVKTFHTSVKYIENRPLVLQLFRYMSKTEEWLKDR